MIRRCDELGQPHDGTGFTTAFRSTRAQHNLGALSGVTTIGGEGQPLINRPPLREDGPVRLQNALTLAAVAPYIAYDEER